MNTVIKTSALIIATAFIGSSAMAQDTKEKQETKEKIKSEKSQEIVIRKNGDKVEKTTIVIDGDNVTINGKPMSEYKGDDLKVIQRNGASAFTSPRARVASGGFKAFDGEHKALLGVTTEKVTDGAKITDLTKESGAEKAGLKEGDVITKVGDKKIASHEDLVEAVGALKPNDKVDITYKRDGKESKTSATLGENKTRSFSFNSDDFNFNMPDIPNFNGNNFFNSRKPKVGLQIQDVEEGKGAKVKEVDDNSPALKAGLKQGDVITAVNGKEVAGVDELKEEIKDIKEGDTVKLTYIRSGKSQVAELKFPKKLKTADL